MSRKESDWPVSLTIRLGPEKKHFSRKQRAARMVKLILREAEKVARKRLKEEGEEKPKIVVSPELNELIWKRGAEKPANRVEIMIFRDEEKNQIVITVPKEEQH
uniref:Large ribosomal subunit protein eL31 n=1 Tax=uncultured korarchaeote TaxID=161241 RepID=A0A1L2JJV3_9CREN|nr:ribosomal protein L31E [uncultured korarchaeote]